MTGSELPSNSSFPLNTDVKGWFDSHSELHKQWLRDLHDLAELSLKEFETSKYIREVLIKHCHHFQIYSSFPALPTAVLATIGPPSECTLLFRADMDALPIKPISPRSTHRNPDVHHACGHDGHMACLLSAAHYLSDATSLSGVALIFQPAEERGGGARTLVENLGLFRDILPSIQAVYALHAFPGVPIGTMGLGAGTILAASDRFCIDIVGKQGHAAMPGPHTADAIQAAAATVPALYGAIAWGTGAFDIAVFAVTGIHSDGEAWNAIPENVRVRGNLRTRDESVRENVKEITRRVAKGTAETFGCTAKVTFRYGNPNTVATPDEVEHAREAAKMCCVETLSVGLSEHDKIRPPMASEDFSFMLRARNGAFGFLGNGENCAQLHSSGMRFREEAIPFGAQWFVWLALQHRMRQSCLK